MSGWMSDLEAASLSDWVSSVCSSVSVCHCVCVM